MAKAEVNLNCSLWIDYEQLIMDCFDCIFISTEDLALFYINFLTGLMISVFLAAPAQRVRRTWNLMEKSVQNELKFFILLWKKYYFIQKLKFSYFNNLFGNVFQTSGVISVITLYCMWNSDAQKVFQLLEEVFSSLAFHWKRSFQVISML